jgi:hypothetical protein
VTDHDEDLDVTVVALVGERGREAPRRYQRQAPATGHAATRRCRSRPLQRDTPPRPGRTSFMPLESSGCPRE